MFSIKANVIKYSCLVIVLLGCSPARHLRLSDTAFILYKNRFSLDKADRFYGKDSIVHEYFPSGVLRAFRSYSIDNEKHLSNLKIGKWVVYFENGCIESEGDYKIGKFVDCGTGGPEQSFYNYKVGHWTYYFSNRSIRATGKYAVASCKIATRCKGGDKLKFGLTTTRWNF